MRHGKTINHLSRTASHRRALMANMASSLVIADKKRIITTLAKAKALRKYLEPLVTKARTNTTHSRRVVFSYLNDKNAVNELFTTVAPKIGDRQGGYLRILKLGPRKSDATEMALIEFVDFNQFTTAEPAKKKTSRKRRAAASKKGAATKKAATKTKAKAKAKEETDTEAGEE